MRRAAFLAGGFAALLACSSPPLKSVPDAGPPLRDAGAEGDGGADAGLDAGAGDAGCVNVDGTTLVQIATATTSDEYSLALPAVSASVTDWSLLGDEALILEVSGPSGLIGHLVLHQGADGFVYTMQLGHLNAGDGVFVRVSPLSASAATPRACVGPATLTAASALGDAGEGLVNAPILEWPVEKRFDDLPMILGWSKARKKYELFYTNENGGTAAICGGGAQGMQAEFARWGRGCDIEGMFSYAGGKSWERCTGTIPYSTITPRQENLHPILYYGDGHNRLFESRGGYGQTCGTSSDAMANGQLVGWNSQNPGNAQSLDAPYVVTIRPLPVDLDALGYAQNWGVREQVIERYAPWLYRITDSELRREGKIDDSRTYPMEEYVFADVYAADVGGSGDPYCSLTVNGGFVLRLELADGGVISGPQMTADYFGGWINWKRLAIPLGEVIRPSDVKHVVFDAYDGDGIYFLALGGLSMPRAVGTNGASIAWIRQTPETVNLYVDDNNSGCVNGTNDGGPPLDGGYPCSGSYAVVPP